MERIRLKEFNVLMVYMLDRFSRETPTKIVSDLHRIVEGYKCRFISVKEGIDSNNDMWQIIMMIFAYMANNYSKMLGIRVREGIRHKKEIGKYKGGRPRKISRVDVEEIKRIYAEVRSLRKTAERYNESRYKDNRISRTYVKRVLEGSI